MNYDELKAAELKALCEERGIKPSRAKADMIEDLKAADATTELTQHDQENGLYASETPSEPSPVFPDLDKGEEAPEEPFWLADGRLHKLYEKTGSLTDEQHAEFCTDVVEEAVIQGLKHFGPGFRVDAADSQSWTYAVNVR